MNSSPPIDSMHAKQVHFSSKSMHNNKSTHFMYAGVCMPKEGKKWFPFYITKQHEKDNKANASIPRKMFYRKKRKKMRKN